MLCNTYAGMLVAAKNETKKTHTHAHEDLKTKPKSGCCRLLAHWQSGRQAVVVVLLLRVMMMLTIEGRGEERSD